MYTAQHFLILETGRLSDPHAKISSNRVARIFLFLGMCLVMLVLSSARVHASTNISSSTTEHWAWNDLIGWIDFYNTNSITVSSQKLTGYASSSAGDISLNCASTRIGNVCGTSNYSVRNDGSGNLSGWGWNDQYGWISFDCHNVTSSDCLTSNYQTWINSTNGVFNNYAWNDIVGWISFNCANHGCGFQYSVITSWIATTTFGYLDSTIFDTGVASGAQFNSVLWHGNQPLGTSVGLQLATSNSSSGPWLYAGSDGTSNTYYTAGADISTPLGYAMHNNFRYFRYRVTLTSNTSGTLSARVDDVVINWSP
ncbi:MAG: hypothetical protein A3B25_00525 [Candidatus Ryanbacteria bacterium RIFCSPLOWO2_01_FULL_48_26]|uniref:Uncharacterized protein n=1 Tax=Candidatus Ryanbacteria bacterium RIFCSPLOWO2_01_FULL_48_26 TaxID=1802126 RepID=A0A1G2GTP2_9BACT|nr:MAG: hypothetical protein A3B25_00525 [Candidatus Ryanbacteria bacterium RIFCSPLOWO2_01_FULL_48_26]